MGGTQWADIDMVRHVTGAAVVLDSELLDEQQAAANIDEKVAIDLFCRKLFQSSERRIGMVGVEDIAVAGWLVQ